MLEIIFASTLSSLIIFAYGNFFCSLIFSKNYLTTINNSEKSLIGIIFLTFVAILLNFFMPLNKQICSFIFLIGIILSLNKKIYLNYYLILFTSLITLLLISYSNINRPDAGLYHLPIINIINENKIILGAANIHFRFAHGSIIQNFSSLYNLYFLNISFITISTASIFSFFLYFVYEKINFFFKLENKFLCLAYLLTFVFSIYSFNRYSGYGNDAVTHLYFIYLILVLLSLNFKGGILHNDLIKISLISFFLAGLKVFMVLTFIIPFFLFLKIKNKKKILHNRATYICFLFIILIVLKSFLTSGCLFYPIKETCFKSVKIYNEKQLLSTASMSEAWSKGWPDQNSQVIGYKNYNKNFQWLKTWKQNHFKYIINKVIPYISLIFLLSFFILFQSIVLKNKEEQKYNINTYSIYLIFLLTIIFVLVWFLKFPLYRFGLSFLYCLFLLLFLITFKNRMNSLTINTIKLLKLTLIIISLTALIAKNLNRIISEGYVNEASIWPKVMIDKKFKKIELSDNGYYYFSNGKECKYGSAPCTYYKVEDLRFRKLMNYKIFWIQN